MAHQKMPGPRIGAAGLDHTIASDRALVVPKEGLAPHSATIWKPALARTTASWVTSSGDGGTFLWCCLANAILQAW
jgi:hypothetical protein